MGLKVVLVRHARPVSQGNDPPLSKEGKESAENLMHLLKEKTVFPEKIYTSPLQRAKETAEIASEMFNTSIVKESALGEAFDDEQLLTLLQGFENTTVMLIGHAPTLANFGVKLVGKNILPFGLAKSSAAVIAFDHDVDFGKGSFVGYLKGE